MTIIFVALMPLPHGSASASRVRAISAGLVAKNVDVEVVGYSSTDSPNSLNGKTQILDKNIRYTLFKKPRPKSQFPFKSKLPWWLVGTARKWENNEIIKYVEALLQRKREKSVVMLYNQRPIEAWRLNALANSYNAVFVQQYAEMQIPGDFVNGWYDGLYLRQQLHLKLMPRRASLNIVISEALAAKCLELGGKRQLVIPALSETGASTRPQTISVNKDFKTITYVGAGSRRDVIPKMLEAVMIAAKIISNLRVRLIGLSKPSEELARSIACEMKIFERCEIFGWINERSKFDRLFSTSNAFILMRSNDQSSQACFPTRLPEFLNTAKPVVISSIGDVGRYLRDEIEAYLAIPDDVESTAAAIVKCFTNQIKSANVGQRGFEACQREFCPIYHGARLIEAVDLCFRV